MSLSEVERPGGVVMAVTCPAAARLAWVYSMAKSGIAVTPSAPVMWTLTKRE